MDMGNLDTFRIKGIVLRRTAVKDADAMVSCIGEDGCFSFYGRGVKKLTSKNGAALSELSYSDFLLIKSKNGVYALKEAAPIESYIKEGDLSAIAVENFLCELISHIFNEDETEGKFLYPYLKKALEAIKEGFEPFTAGIICFAKALIELGLGLEVDSCVRCKGKKGIVGLSLFDGGFVCADCLVEEDVKLDPYLLKIIRYVFRCGLDDLSRVPFKKEDLLPLYDLLATHLENATNFKPRSLELLRQL